MHTLRINVEPKLVHLEKLLQQLRHRLPFAYLKPRTGKTYIDFILDLPEEKLGELRTWLMYCGWDVQIGRY